MGKNLTPSTHLAASSRSASSTSFAGTPLTAAQLRADHALEKLNEFLHNTDLSALDRYMRDTLGLGLAEYLHETLSRKGI